jgi:hypothetical protein
MSRTPLTEPKELKNCTSTKRVCTDPVGTADLFMHAVVPPLLPPFPRLRLLNGGCPLQQRCQAVGAVTFINVDLSTSSNSAPATSLYFGEGEQHGSLPKNGPSSSTYPASGMAPDREN